MAGQPERAIVLSGRLDIASVIGEREVPFGICAGFGDGAANGVGPGLLDLRLRLLRLRAADQRPHHVRDADPSASRLGVAPSLLFLL